MIKKGKYIAVRPNALIEARYDLKSRQNDIMDMVLSKIEDDNNYLYELNVNDYRKLYKSDTSNIYRDLKKAVKSMEGLGFYLINSTSKGVEKETFFAWFASIDYLETEGKIVVEVGQRLKGLLIEMKKRIYYKIEYPLNFSSIYSKRIYYYLKSFEDTGWRVDNLDVLRKKLQCPGSYNKYGLFRTKVLDIAKKEINSCSDISFDIEEIKNGRKVNSIKFIIKSNNNAYPQKQIVKDEVAFDIEEKHLDVIEKDIRLIMDITKNEFSEKTAMLFRKLSNGDNNQIQKVYDYMNTKKIKENRAGYIRRLLENFEEPKTSVGTTKFNNFEPRKYSERYEHLREICLLGYATDKERREFDEMRGDINEES